MSTEFLRLYRELERITPSTTFDEKKLTDQRNDVMHRLGYKQMGGDRKYTAPAKFHGKKAREDAHEARQVAMLGDAKAKAQRRMEVHKAVHDVEHLNSLARELSTFVKDKKPVPGGLMRKLVGNDAMRTKGPPVDNGPADKWQPPHLAREPRQLRKDFTVNSWSLDERMLLNKLYLETPKPTVKTKIDSWKVFYENVCSRFIQFYPARTLKESIEKLEDLIRRRAIKEVGESEYWDSLRSPAAKSAGNTELIALESTSATSRQSNSTNLSPKFQKLGLGGSMVSTMVGSSITR